jgi:membrane-bound lytic murein transglycosylase D
LSTKRSILFLTSLPFFVILVMMPSSTRAAEMENLPRPWLSSVLTPRVSFGKAASAAPVPGPVPVPAAPEKGKAGVPFSPLVATGQGVLSPPEGKGQKGTDLVMSPKDVEGEIARNEEPETGEERDGGFFANAPDEIDRGEEGNYAGLTSRIEKFIRYFQNKGRGKFELWLSRSGKYSELMRDILAKYGLPGDLVYLALIESGFSPKAYSVARAAGPWQFIAGTARRYGLRVDWWADERRDYEKSTHAAASYLRDLYDMFDSWPLAAAAYNAGEGKIQRAVSRYKSDDYSELIRHRYLARETKDYVPKMIAALSIATQPDKYGFGDVQYEDPLVFDKVSVPGGTDLEAMGRIIGVDVGPLRELNPELKRFCTPPNQDAYEIRLPQGFGPVAEERIEEIRTDAKVTFLLHSVGKKETLASISKRYNSPVSILKEINGLRRDSLRRTSRMIIPVTGLYDEDLAPGKEISPDQLKLAHMRVDEGYQRGQKMRVRKGETLSNIARKTGVPVRELMRANGLRNPGMLRAGAILRIPRSGSVSRGNGRGAAPGNAKEVRHVVRPGDTLSSIAKGHRVNVNRLAERNHMNPEESLRSGRVLLIPTES